MWTAAVKLPAAPSRVHSAEKPGAHIRATERVVNQEYACSPCAVFYCRISCCPLFSGAMGDRRCGVTSVGL